MGVVGERPLGKVGDGDGAAVAGPIVQLCVGN